MTIDTIAAVIPLYNKASYVSHAIASVLAQSRPVDEIIVVDDASTDDGVERVRAFRDPHIRLIRRATHRPGGVSAARNLAIRSATSRWIALLDADDRWQPDFIDEIAMLLSLADEQTGLVFTGWRNTWPDRAATRDAYGASCNGRRFTRLDIDRFVSVWLRHRECPVFTSAVALRRDVLLDAGLFCEQARRGEDKDMWLRMMARADALGSPRICSAYHRGVPGQLSGATVTNTRHCICATLDHLIAAASGPRRRALMRLFNQEVFDYARFVRQRERVSPEVYRGFHVRLDPARYAVLLALSYLPIAVQQVVRSLLLRARSAASRTRSAPGAAASPMS